MSKIKVIERLKKVFGKQKKIDHKIFCIGFGKTGTTSLQQAFIELGFKVGNQREAELLATDYHNRIFTKLIDYCNTADVFQDVPFCFPLTFKTLDTSFPGSKFILTERNNSEEWYASFCNFQSRLFGKGENLGWEELKKLSYVYKGWVYENRINLFNLTEQDDPFDKDRLISIYEKHNKDVKEYFKNRQQDLLIINVAQSNSYSKFCNFIGVKSKKRNFPWANKTSEISIK